MTEVDNEIFQLIEAVKHSKTYINYDRARVTLKSDPELMERVNKYREENFKLQNSVDDGTLHDRIDKFYNDNMELSEEPRVRAFLNAELALCRMLQAISEGVVEGINFE
ncbi:MAG: YlbF family regulator [Lachnospiraceae bacterium]|nr:YlbF family regulator [Lachnospiraceae bacterium]